MIAGRLPGRSEEEIKKYWNTYLSKKVEEKHQNNNKLPSTTTNSMSSVQSPWCSQNNLNINSMESPNPVIVRPKVVRLTKGVVPRQVANGKCNE